MSSNQTVNRPENGKDTKQMTSIARKLHHFWMRKSLGRCISFDLFLPILLFVFTLTERELVRFGSIHFDYIRSFCHADIDSVNGVSNLLPILKQLYYTVANKDHVILLRVPLYSVLCMIAAVLALVIVFQLLRFFFSYLPDAKKIRKRLKPINDIALKADELSRMSFSEDKYQEIENAISRLQPDESELLSFSDADLQGIEAAMNNLLIHMRELNRQQARFVNDASHELRTPIAVIQGYANMLSRWGRDDEKVLDESISAIAHEADHMKYLVEQLLFLARGDSGRTVLKKESVVLGSMMQEIYEESFMIDEEHPYRFRPANEEITIEADAALLKQAVRILIDNAAKYTNKGDEIYISYGMNNDHAPYIRVQDTGIGMAENDVAHMFERFYRSDEVRSFQGTGLGLSIAKWIVDKHEGHFEILSRTELGTRIYIVLPQAKTV